MKDLFKSRKPWKSVNRIVQQTFYRAFHKNVAEVNVIDAAMVERAAASFESTLMMVEETPLDQDVNLVITHGELLHFVSYMRELDEQYRQLENRERQVAEIYREYEQHHKERERFKERYEQMRKIYESESIQKAEEAREAILNRVAKQSIGIAGSPFDGIGSVESQHLAELSRHLSLSEAQIKSGRDSSKESLLRQLVQRYKQR